MVKSGEIDEFDEVDLVESMVSSATKLDTRIAGEHLPNLQKICTKFAREAIAIIGRDIFIKVPYACLREARINIAALGIRVSDVTIDVID